MYMYCSYCNLGNLYTVFSCMLQPLMCYHMSCLGHMGHISAFLKMFHTMCAWEKTNNNRFLDDIRIKEEGQ